MSYIEEFWIINGDGTQLFKYPINPDDDERYADFFIAFQRFGLKLSENDETGVKTLKMGIYEYYFSMDDDNQIYFIIKMKPKSVNHKFINKKLLNIKSVFLSDYKNYFEFMKKRDMKEIDVEIFEPFNEKFLEVINERDSIISLQVF